jgi:putative aldouronate transport system substrate-binding protein
MVNGTAWQTSTLDTIASMFGAMPVTKQGNYRDLSLAPETKQAIDFLFKAAQMGAINQGELTLGPTALTNAVDSGRVFCFIGNTAGEGFNMVVTNPQETWASPGPLLSNQNMRPTMGYAKESMGWIQTFVSKSAPDPAKIAHWIAYMSSSKALLMEFFGFKNRDYVLNKQGQVITTKQYLKDEANWPKTGLTGFWPFYNIPWFNHVSPPPTRVAGNDGLQAWRVQLAWPTYPKTYLYDNVALQMPATLIPSNTPLGQDQVQIPLYEQTQIAHMIFAPNMATVNSLYKQMIQRVQQMGLNKVDAVINKQFHKQEAQLNENIKGINP